MTRIMWVLNFIILLVGAAHCYEYEHVDDTCNGIASFMSLKQEIYTQRFSAEPGKAFVFYTQYLSCRSPNQYLDPVAHCSRLQRRRCSFVHLKTYKKVHSSLNLLSVFIVALPLGLIIVYDIMTQRFSWNLKLFSDPPLKICNAGKTCCSTAIEERFYQETNQRMIRTTFYKDPYKKRTTEAKDKIGLPLA